MDFEDQPLSEEMLRAWEKSAPELDVGDHYVAPVNWTKLANSELAGILDLIHATKAEGIPMSELEESAFSQYQLAHTRLMEGLCFLELSKKIFRVLLTHEPGYVSASFSDNWLITYEDGTQGPWVPWIEMDGQMMQVSPWKSRIAKYLHNNPGSTLTAVIANCALHFRPAVVHEILNQMEDEELIRSEYFVRRPPTLFSDGELTRSTSNDRQAERYLYPTPQIYSIW